MPVKVPHPSKGWSAIAKKGYHDLPEKIKNYVKKIKEILNAPINKIPIGP